jgi:hypothetical protein
MTYHDVHISDQFFIVSEHFNNVNDCHHNCFAMMLKVMRIFPIKLNK